MTGDHQYYSNFVLWGRKVRVLFKAEKSMISLLPMLLKFQEKCKCFIKLQTIPRQNSKGKIIPAYDFLVIVLIDKKQ